MQVKWPGQVDVEHEREFKHIKCTYEKIESECYTHLSILTHSMYTSMTSTFKIQEHKYSVCDCTHDMLCDEAIVWFYDRFCILFNKEHSY